MLLLVLPIPIFVKKIMSDFDLFVERLERGVDVGDTVGSLCMELGIDSGNLCAETERILGTDAYKLVECYKFDLPLPFL